MLHELTTTMQHLYMKGFLQYISMQEVVRFYADHRIK